MLDPIAEAAVNRGQDAQIKADTKVGDVHAKRSVKGAAGRTMPADYKRQTLVQDIFLTTIAVSLASPANAESLPRPPGPQLRREGLPESQVGNLLSVALCRAGSDPEATHREPFVPCAAILAVSEPAFSMPFPYSQYLSLSFGSLYFPPSCSECGSPRPGPWAAWAVAGEPAAAREGGREERRRRESLAPTRANFCQTPARSLRSPLPRYTARKPASLQLPQQPPPASDTPVTSWHCHFRIGQGS